MKKKQRHFTREEILNQCNAVARQRRTSDRSPWTALSIVTSYALMTSEGFRGQRIQSIHSPVSELFSKYSSGDINIDEYSAKLKDKVGWTVECEKYTQADVRGKKGSYIEWINAKQLDPVNSINEQSTAFLILFFNELMNIGYGEKRLSRVRDKVNELFKLYSDDMSGKLVSKWRQELIDVAGIAFEDPKDPMKQ